MVMAKLHVICGNCGSSDDFEFQYDPKGNDISDEEEKYEPAVYISCQNCGTLHDLSDNAKLRKDKLEGIIKKKEEEKPKMRKFHICLNIRGALRGQMFNDFINDDGSPKSRDEAFEFLCDQLAMGRKVLPLADCENFDYQTGCPGHDIEEGEDV